MRLGPGVRVTLPIGVFLILAAVDGTDKAVQSSTIRLCLPVSGSAAKPIVATAMIAVTYQ